MELNLQPTPTTEQLTVLREQFGDAFRFIDEPRALLHRD
jgi:hypothetical protein